MNHVEQDSVRPSAAVVPTSERNGTARKYPVQAAELRAVMSETGYSEESLGDWLRARRGTGSRALVRQYLDGTKPLTLDVLEDMPPAVRERWFARGVQRVMNGRESLRSSLDQLQHVANGTDALGNAARTVIAALADNGRLDPHERPGVAKAWRSIRMLAENAERDAMGAGR